MTDKVRPTKEEVMATVQVLLHAVGDFAVDSAEGRDTSYVEQTMQYRLEQLEEMITTLTEEK
jgi:hypothetical protein